MGGRQRRSARSAISMRGAIDAECPISGRLSTRPDTHFVEPFMTAPSPGDHRRRDEERALRHARRPISTRSARRCRSNTRRSSTTAFCCSSIAPIWRSNATSPTRTARSAISSALSSASSRRSTRRSSTCRATACGCMSAGAITKAPHDCDVPLDDILAGHAAGQCRRLCSALRQSAARPRIPRASQNTRSPTTRSSSPASSTA